MAFSVDLDFACFSPPLSLVVEHKKFARNLPGEKWNSQGRMMKHF